MTQLEWLTSIPWPSSVAYADISAGKLRDRAFLEDARKQLDEDHYGLEKIKKRLIEYLAVVRLKQLQAERESLLQSSTGSASDSESSQRTAGDATSRALALISKALNSSTTAGAEVSDAGKHESRAVSTHVGAPAKLLSQPKRGSGSKAVKGPILL